MHYPMFLELKAKNTMSPLHNDPQIAFASVIGFVSLGKALQWFGHFISSDAEFFAGCSYILASIAACVTIYYTIKKNRPPKG